MAEQLTGIHLEGYTILEEIGMGGMATVYRAERQSDGEIVAVKVIAQKLSVSGDFVKRFEREASVMAAFDHPYILPVYDFGESDGQIYLTMRLLPGGSLKDLIVERRLRLDEAARLIVQISDALDYAHGKGVVHRDLKPANVLLGEDGTPYLADFGIAKFREESVGLTATGMIVGTPSYMAPEQWRSEPIDQRTDVYAFGIMIFEILTGRVPFSSDNPFSLMYRHLDEPPPPIRRYRRDAPESLERVIRRALAKIPERRYPSAGALAAALQESLRDAPLVEDQTGATMGGDTILTGDRPTPATSLEDDETVTAESPFTPVTYDEPTFTDAYHDGLTYPEGEYLATDQVDSEYVAYNAVDVGARALLERAKEAAREKDGDSRELAEAVVNYVQNLRERAKQKPDVDQGPYRALDSYTVADSKLFYGREEAIDAMLERSPFARFTVLHAESGAGKTSLLRAGLMPRLLAGGFLPLYVAVRRRPPHETIKHTLLPDASVAPSLADSSLRAYLSALVEIIGSNREIFIFIDQFETFFTDVFTDEDRADFVSELAECLDDELLPIRVTLAMRTEYFGLLASFEPHIPQPFAQEFLLRKLTTNEAERALVLPARAQGYHYQGDVVAQILDDLADVHGEVAPPQLQLVGGALIDALPEGRKAITAEDYVAAGRAEGVLRGYMERLLERFTADNRRLAQRVIEGLVRADQTRDVRTADSLREELAAQHILTDNLNQVLKSLQDNHVLRIVDLDDHPAYELVHDFLAQQVQLDPEIAARKAAQELLERRVRDYERYGSLLTEQELGVISAQQDQLRLTDASRRLISQTRARRRRQRQITAGLITLAVLGLIAAMGIGLLAAIQDSRNRQKQLEISLTSEAEITAERNVAESGRVALQALLELDEQHLDAALLLGIESTRIVDTREARSSLLTSLQSAPQLVTYLHDQNTWVHSVAFSPDGKTFVSAGDDGQILLWDGRQPVWEVDTGYKVWEAAFTTDGTQIISVGDDGVIHLWDAATGDPIERFQQQFDDAILCLAIHGDVLATGHNDGAIRLWDIPSGELLDELTGHSDHVLTLTFSRDGSQLASGGRDILLPERQEESGVEEESEPDKFIILLRDMSAPNDADSIKTLALHTDWILDLAFSLDGSILASGSADNTLRLWNTSDGTPLGQPISDHTGWVRTVAFSPDGTVLASGSGDRSIILPDGTVLASGRGDRSIILRNASTGLRLQEIPPLIGHKDEVHTLAFSPDGQQLISGDELGDILVWRTAPSQPLEQTIAAFDGTVYSVAFSADGSQLLSGSGDTSARLLDVSSGDTIGEALMAGNEILTVAISGGRMAYGDADGRVYLVNGADVTTIDAHVAQVSATRSVAFSPDGSLLASGGDDMQVHLWDAASGQAVGEVLQGHSDWVLTLAFSPDGSRLASSGMDRTIILWDVATQQPVATIETPHTDGINDITFSHDGHMLASASRDGSIILWDVASQTAIGLPLSGHDRWVISVAFSPDDRYLASGGRDRTIILWDVATQQVIGQPFSGHVDWVWSVAFSPDGTLLASGGGSRDKTVRLWDVSLLSWIDRSCAIANRALTLEEWATYLPGETPRPTCPS